MLGSADLVLSRCHYDVVICFRYQLQPSASTLLAQFSSSNYFCCSLCFIVKAADVFPFIGINVNTYCWGILTEAVSWSWNNAKVHFTEPLTDEEWRMMSSSSFPDRFLLKSSVFFSHHCPECLSFALVFSKAEVIWWVKTTDVRLMISHSGWRLEQTAHPCLLSWDQKDLRWIRTASVSCRVTNISICHSLLEMVAGIMFYCRLLNNQKPTGGEDFILFVTQTSEYSMLWLLGVKYRV